MTSKTSKAPLEAVPPLEPEPEASDSLDLLTLAHLLELPEQLAPGSPWNAHVPLLRFLAEATRPALVACVGPRESEACAHLRHVMARVDAAGDVHAYLVGDLVGSSSASRATAEPWPEEQAVRRSHHADLQSALLAAQGHRYDLLLLEQEEGSTVAPEQLEGWLSVLSDRGVLVLRPAGRHSDHPLARWGEALSERFACFLSSRGDGCLALAVGDEVCSPLRALVEAEGARREELQALFAELGARVEDCAAREFEMAPRPEAGGVRAALGDEVGKDVQRLRESERRLARHISALQALLRAEQAEVARLRKSLGSSEASRHRDVASVQSSLNMLQASLGMALVRRLWHVKDRYFYDTERKKALYDSAKRWLLLRFGAR